MSSLKALVLVARLLLLPCVLLGVASAASAFLPSPTSPYTYGTGASDQHAHFKVDDGFWHDGGCSPGGPPDYSCGCTVGVPGSLKAPKLTMNGTTLEVEYWIRNAYCITADSSNPNRPFLQFHYIYLFSISPSDGVSGSFSTIAPYWEHGKVFIPNQTTCNRYQAVLQISYLVGGQTFFDYASSEIAGPTGQDANGRSCLDDDRSCPNPITAAQPVNVGSGNMRYDETLFSIQENTGPLTLGVSYNSRTLTSGPLGAGFTHTFAETMKPLGGSANLIQWINGRGEKTIFYSGGPGSVDFGAVWPADATGTVSLSGGIYTFKDLDGNLTKFGSTAGEWQSTEDRWGNRVFGTYTSGKLTSITDPENRIWTLVSDPTSGKLTTVTDPESRVWTFAYDGSGRLQSIRDPLHPTGNPWRQFTYVTGNPSEPTVLAQVQDDGLAVLEGHEYDTAGRTISSWSGDTVVTAGVPHPGPNARSLVTLVYNSSTQTTVTTKIDPTTNSVSTFTISAPAGRFLPLSISGSCPSCGASADLQTYAYDEFNRMTTKTIGSGTDQVQTNYVTNGNGMVTTRTEAVGKPEERITTYTYGKVDWPSFVTQMQEPSVANPGVSNFKTTTYSWGIGACAGFSGETCLETKVAGFVSPTTSETHTVTTKFSSNPSHRVTSIAGPGSGQLTSMTYYSDTDMVFPNRRGRLATSIVQTSTTPTSLTTAFDEYDLFGTAKKVTDPNLVDMTRTTDAKGRILTVVSKKPSGDQDEAADYTTLYTYDSLRKDRLSEVQLPALNKIHYDYESGTNRLTDTVRVDSSGNQRERLHLTLNTIGGKSLEEAQLCTTPANPCSVANWVTKRSDSFTYETHNRLLAVLHPVGGRLDYTYDTRGNLGGIKDERHTGDALPNLAYAYDGLNRVISVAQKRTISPGTPVTTGYIYDKLDNLKQVTDPKGNLTSYESDDFGQIRKQTSPVSGITTYSYDAAGNLLTSTDANNATTTRTYDVANRVLTATSTRSGFATEVVTYTYDGNEPGDEPNPPNPPKAHPKRYGKGRLASMSDPSGSSQYAYERRGLLKKEWKTIELDTYGLQYGYDVNGNRSTMRYPSGRLATFTFDFADRPLSVSSPGTTYVTSAVYQPFGPESQINYGNGTSKTMTFDLRYRPLTNTLAKSPTTISQQTFAVDGVGNISSITDNLDSNYNRGVPTPLVYDDLNRLTAASSGSSLWTTGSYNYDDLGSVTSLTVGTRTASFVYSGATPKLTSVTESGPGTRAVSYDAAGNETAVGPGAFTYSARSFLATADNLIYTYDGRGLRATTALSSTVFPISLTISPVSVVKGTPATGTVTLNVGAPSSLQVSLKTSDLAVAGSVDPWVVSFSQGEVSKTFQINSSSLITADAKAVISATYGNVTKSETLTVTTTPRLFLISVSPRAVQGGGAATGTVTLTGLAPSGGALISLASSSGTATFPGGTTVTVPFNQPSATFAINTSLVSASQAVTVTASYLGVSRWASLTIMQVLAQGEEIEIEKSWFGERVSAFRLARLSPALGTSGFLAGPTPKGDDSSGEDVFSFALATELASAGAGGVRPMDGPIYSVPGPSKRNYLYSPEMNLLAESEVSSPRDRQILYEYIWFNGHPVAQVDGGTVTHWTFTDHLGTPTIQTDAAGAVFWRVEYEPYGRVFAKRPTTLADQHQPLRLPGQEAEQFNLDINGLTERSYNVFRWYRANWGRYTQPDPVGLEEGDTDLFLYARNQPLLLIDPFGLRACGLCDECPSGTWSFQGLGFTAGFFRWGRAITAGTFKCAKGIGLTELKVTIDCKLKGPFVGIGGGLVFSVPGVPSACGCNSRNLLGEQPETTFISAGPAGVELGDCATRGGPTATFGAGRSFGAGSAGLVCNVKRRF